MTSGCKFNDPAAVMPEQVAQALSKYGTATVQFSRPDACTPAVLAKVNQLCCSLSDRLKIRFFGHYGGAFDAAVLRHLPDVKNLSVDAVMRILNEDQIAKLRHLRQLQFAVHEFDRPDFLATFDLSGLTTLVLGANRKQNLDLAPLTHAKALTALTVEGHRRGFEAIARLGGLTELTLAGLSGKQSLGLLNGLGNLQDLRLILGARDGLEELAAPNLRSLQILRVRGLVDLGDLARFHQLHRLRIEDQLQIKALDLSGVRLQQLHLYNCKNLARLDGLQLQDQLRALFVSKVALDMDGLRDFVWPPSVRSMSLLSSRQSWNDATAAALAGRGIDRQSILWD